MSDLIKGAIEKAYPIVDGVYEDLIRSNFPKAVDDINEMQDITADLVDLQNQFYTYVNNKDFANVSKLLENNPQLQSCLFNAEKYNSIRDAVVALQRYYLTDIQDYIVNISQPKGEWKKDTVYKKYDVVSYIYEDATQFYCARAMEVPMNILPTNTNYWTPVTLRGMRGHTGLGLTPSSGWNKTEQYYNFIDDDGIPHVSMIYYENMFWAATKNNINSKPTWDVSPTEDVYSTNEDWEIILALRQTADGIVFPEGQSLTQIKNAWNAKLQDWDNRTFENMESFISNAYTYYAIKDSTNPLIWHEYANNSSTNKVFSEIISKKINANEWQIQKICHSDSHPINYTIKYTKDANGNWKGVRM